MTYDEGIHRNRPSTVDMPRYGLCGLASVIERPIISVYPSTINGLNDEVAALLNRRMKPRRNYEYDRDEVYIMWTSTSRPKSGTMWRAITLCRLSRPSTVHYCVRHCISSQQRNKRLQSGESHYSLFVYLSHYSLFVYLSHYSFISQIIRLYQTQLLNIEPY